MPYKYPYGRGDDWRNHPEWESKRYGAAAYVAPVNAWPDITSLPERHKDIEVNRVNKIPGMGAQYNVNYTRTGRDLGTHNTLYNLGSDANISPQIMDQILNTAEELDRVDPNFYMYNLQNNNQQQQYKFAPPTAAGPERAITNQALIAPYGQGTLQQQNTSADAFMQAIQNLMGGG